MWIPPFRRPASEAFAASAATPWSASAVTRISWKEEIEPITGLLYSHPSLWIFVGPPGSGKTTMACRVAAEQAGPTVFLSAEMPVGRSLASLLQRSGLGAREDALILRQASSSALAAYAGDGAVLVCDSLQMLSFTAGDLRALLDGHVFALILAISQVTKTGTARGSNEFLHHADLVVEVSQDRAWRCTKSRFEVAGKTGHVTRRAIPKTPRDNVVHLPSVDEVES